MASYVHPYQISLYSEYAALFSVMTMKEFIEKIGNTMLKPGDKPCNLLQTGSKLNEK